MDIPNFKEQEYKKYVSGSFFMWIKIEIIQILKHLKNIYSN